MAQHPFAEAARREMEENGIVFNADGTTSVKQAEPVVVELSQPQAAEEPAPKEQPQVDETQPETPPEESKLVSLQRAEIERLKAEKAQLEQNVTQISQNAHSSKETELEAEIAKLKQDLALKTQAEQIDEVRALLDCNEFDSSSLDDEVMLEIRDNFIKPVAHELESTRERLERLETNVTERFREPTAEEQLAVVKQNTISKVIEQVPDFMTVFESKEFQDKLNQPDPRFPSSTYAWALQAAEENGNVDFIVQEIDNFLGYKKAPDVSQVADVGATNGVGSQATVQEQSGSRYTFTDEEELEMLRERQIGNISRQQYSEYRAKLDAKRHSV